MEMRRLETSRGGQTLLGRDAGRRFLPWRTVWQLFVRRQLNWRSSSSSNTPAGDRGYSYDWKVHSFSLETEKLSTAAQVNLLHDLYLERKKTKTQQQAGYVKFLRQTYLSIKEEYLQILKAEDFELETEISRILN